MRPTHADAPVAAMLQMSPAVYRVYRTVLQVCVVVTYCTHVSLDDLHFV